MSRSNVDRGRNMSVRVMSLVWDAPFPTPTAKLIALKLADCANDDGANVFPSRRTVERATMCSTAAVKNWLAVLERANLLLVERRSLGGAHRDTTVRRFNMVLLRGLVDGTHRFVPRDRSWGIDGPSGDSANTEIGGHVVARSPDGPAVRTPARGHHVARTGPRGGPKPSTNRHDPSARERAGQVAASASPAIPPAIGLIRIENTDPLFPAVLDVLARTSPPFAETWRTLGYADVRPDQLLRARS